MFLQVYVYLLYPPLLITPSSSAPQYSSLLPQPSILKLKLIYRLIQHSHLIVHCHVHHFAPESHANVRSRTSVFRKILLLHTLISPNQIIISPVHFLQQFLSCFFYHFYIIHQYLPFIVIKKELEFRLISRASFNPLSCQYHTQFSFYLCIQFLSLHYFQTLCKKYTLKTSLHIRDGQPFSHCFLHFHPGRHPFPV